MWWSAITLSRGLRRVHGTMSREGNEMRRGEERGYRERERGESFFPSLSLALEGEDGEDPESGDESSSSVPTVRGSAQPFSMRVKERLRSSVCAPRSAH